MGVDVGDSVVGELDGWGVDASLGWLDGVGGTVMMSGGGKVVRGVDGEAVQAVMKRRVRRQRM